MPNSNTTNTCSSYMDDHAVGVSLGLMHGIYPYDRDLSISIERTSKGLEVYVGSQYISHMIELLNLSQDNKPKQYPEMYYDTCSAYSVDDENTHYMGYLFTGRESYSRIAMPFLYDMDMSKVTHCIYTIPIPDSMYPKIRRQIVDALVEFMDSITRYHIRKYVIATEQPLRCSTGSASPSITRKLKPLNGAQYDPVDGSISKKITGVNLCAVEIEGGWLRRPSGVYRDGSVTVDLPRCTCNSDDEAPCEGCHAIRGEINCKPQKLSNVLDYVDEHYPDFMDSSCGIHIHVSFSEDLLSYSKLMSPKFWRYFQKSMHDWGVRNNINPNSRFWKRLNGDNRFCKKRFQPIKQYMLEYKDSARYTQLNYCWKQHGTLECRVLPTFNQARIAKSAIAEFMNIINSYLADNIEEYQYTSEVLV